MIQTNISLNNIMPRHNKSRASRRRRHQQKQHQQQDPVMGGGIADTAKLFKGGSACGSASGCGVQIFGSPGQQTHVAGDSTIATKPVNMFGGSNDKNDSSRGGKGLEAVIVPAGLFAAARYVRTRRANQGSRNRRAKSYRRRR
jgi:hypothetical protein